MPAEIAYFGTLYPFTWLVSSSLALLISGNLFIPVLYKMHITSVYEVRAIIISAIGKEMPFIVTHPLKP